MRTFNLDEQFDGEFDTGIDGIVINGEVDAVDAVLEPPPEQPNDEVRDREPLPERPPFPWRMAIVVALCILAVLIGLYAGRAIWAKGSIVLGCCAMLEGFLPMVVAYRLRQQ